MKERAIPYSSSVVGGGDGEARISIVNCFPFVKASGNHFFIRKELYQSRTVGEEAHLVSSLGIVDKWPPLPLDCPSARSLE